MQILSKSGEYENIVEFASRDAVSAHLAVGSGDSHAHIIEFRPGGSIGRHEAGFGQLFAVLTGSGWVSGDDECRVEVDAGDVVYFERGEWHAKGSDSGMRALVVQIRDLALAL